MGNYFSYQNEDIIDRKVKEAVEKNNNWKERYEELLTDYQVLQSQIKLGENRSVNVNSEISMENLKQYIHDEILATTANSKYIPDPIEKRVYLTIYKTVLETLLQLSNTTSLIMFGHKITFQIQPE